MTARDLAQRRRVFFTMLTALTFRYSSGREPPLIPPLRTGSLAGLGRFTVGMARQGFDLQLTRYDGEGWRAPFFPAGRAHSLPRRLDQPGNVFEVESSFGGNRGERHRDSSGT